VTHPADGKLASRNALLAQDEVSARTFLERVGQQAKERKGERFNGIPALEDKVVQQAARMLLEPIYEQAFLGFSYGFRPGRSQHRALDALAVAIGRKVSWVLDADIRAFDDTIEHAMDAEVVRAQDRGQAHRAAADEVAAYRRDGGWRATRSGLRAPRRTEPLGVTSRPS
jgi:hypothetical protein